MSTPPAPPQTAGDVTPVRHVEPAGYAMPSGAEVDYAMEAVEETSRRRSRRDAAPSGPGDPARSEAPSEVRPPARPYPAPPPTGITPGHVVDGYGEGRTSITTTVTTVTVDGTVQVIPVEPVQQQAPAPLLTAATVSDADRRDNYLRFLSRHPFEYSRIGLDLSRRQRFQILDERGRPVHGATVSLSGQGVQTVGRTRADGRWDFYPGVLSPQSGGELVATITPSPQSSVAARVRLSLPMQGDGADVVLRLDGYQAETPRALDLAFLIDATGSMGDELRYVHSEVASIVQEVRRACPETVVRVGATFYRDRTDSAPLEMIPFTSDIAGFVHAMHTIQATGGGDYPEDLDAGLAAAFGRMQWAPGAVQTLVLIGDAPPQRYASGFTYREAAAEASRRGIRILPVAASGANREVEMLFRALGALTVTPYVYLTDDSGIGNRHLEADTDRVAVEYFADVLVRLLVSDLRGEGMHESPVLGGFQ